MDHREGERRCTPRRRRPRPPPLTISRPPTAPGAKPHPLRLPASPRPESAGKDLTRICLPVYFNEPLSALQKFAEELEYSDLLDRAACEPAGSPLRQILVAAFAVSGYASTVERTFKPFNPLETETFELMCHDKGFRLLSEKVSHNPTVMACTADGRGWTLKCVRFLAGSSPLRLRPRLRLLSPPLPGRIRCSRAQRNQAPLLSLFPSPPIASRLPAPVSQRDAGGADPLQGALHRARPARPLRRGVPRRGGAHLEQSEIDHQ